MIFGKKPGEGAGTPSAGPVASAVVGEKSVEERRPPAPIRSLGEDLRALVPPRSPRPSDEKTSILSSHLSFDGTLKFSGKVVIDCEFRGSVATDDTLVVGPAGRLEAEIAAGIVEIAGKLRGNIKARTRVKILSGGEVHGNIETPTISMDEGVMFEGNCTRPPHDAGKTEGAPAQGPAQPARIAPSLRKALGTVLAEPQSSV
jgi:cytoskeletal protein CcmA (bactofilin family)